MKIGLNDLDKDVLDRITKLDSLVSNYNNASGNVVMYNGSSFYNGKFPVFENTKINESSIYTTNDLELLKEHIYSSGNNFISSFDTPLALHDYYTSNFTNLNTLINNEFLCKAEATILRYDSYKGYYYLYLNNGKVIQIDQIDPSIQISYDFLSILKTNFTCSELTPLGILNVFPYKTGHLVSTVMYGVFYIDIKNGIYEKKFQENNVKYIQDLLNGNILMIKYDIKNSVGIYDFKSGKKIETYNNLSVLDQQYPARFLYTDKMFFVLGKNTGFNSSTRLLHGWKMDLANISYDNIDAKIHPHKDSKEYQIKFMTTKSHYLFLSGLKNHKFFTWRYDLEEMDRAPVELIIDFMDICYDELNFAEPVDSDKIYFNKNDMVVKVDFDGNLLENLRLKEFNSINKIYSHDDRLLVLDGKDLISYILPTYHYYPNIDISIYNSNKQCNNINILIASRNSKERAIFYDGDTGQQIIPEFYMISGGKYSAIKIKNCESKNICMRLNLAKDSFIDGIVINPNNMFSK